MKVIEIIVKDGDKELFLFSKFEASWDASVDDMEVIIPWAIHRAIEIGRRQKEIEFRKLLGF